MRQIEHEGPVTLDRLHLALGSAVTPPLTAAGLDPGPSRLWPVVGDWLVRAGRRLLLWHRRARARRELRRLDARLLDDIGMTPAKAEAEWRKPFWRA